MKLHLGTKATILCKPPELPVVYYNDHIYHYANPYIYVTRIEDGLVIQKLRYEDVGVLQIYGEKLFVFTNDVYVLDLKTFEILEIIRLSKGLINKVEFASYDLMGGVYILSKMSREIVLVKSGKPELVGLSGSCCDRLFILPEMFGFVDKESIVLYQNGKIVLKEEVDVEDLVELFTTNAGVYTINRMGIVREWIKGVEFSIETTVDSVGYFENILHVSDGYMIRKYNLEGEMLGMIDFQGEIEHYCGKATVQEIGSNENIKRKRLNENIAEVGQDIMDRDSEEFSLESEGVELICGSEDDEIELGSENESIKTDMDMSRGKSGITFNQILPSIIVVEDRQIIIHKNFKIMKMFIFNNNSTDSLLFNDMLLVATASGDIAYTMVSGYVEGEYLFNGRMIRCHDDSITTVAGQGSIIFTGSRDTTTILWKILTAFNNKLELVEIKRFAQSLEPITALDYGHGILAIATYDYILQIYKEDGYVKRIKDESIEEIKNIGNVCEDESNILKNTMGVHKIEDYNNLSFTNILVQKVHSRQINNVYVTSKYIITVSSDKSAKFFTHDGESIKTVTGDKYLCATYSSDHIALCGHKTIKVLDWELNQVAFFQVKRPVLSCCFQGGMLLGSSDIVRVYDIKKGKCVKTYDFGAQNCWSFTFPALCGDNQISLLSDVSKEMNEKLAEDMRLEREENQLLGVYCREKNYKRALEIAVKRNDYKKMFRIVCDEYYSGGNLESLEVFNSCKSKLVEMLLKNPGLKYMEVFNMIIKKENNIIKEDKLYEVCKKHSKAVEDIYTLLLGLDIYE
ncbi:hypothetical protein PAEPH01_1309 [Pancytospora epiphaga]|nr:hypothetical protein PAEPH01_1309 [Pancytospora epiphaga]